MSWARDMERNPARPCRVLLLGGTMEAGVIAARLDGDRRFDAVLSLAGRTATPKASALKARTGGFGGIDGLAAYLADNAIDVVIDATHPFATLISANALAACRKAGVTLIALERPPWQPIPGDHWRHFSSAEAAIASLPPEPCRVFSGLGRLSLDALSLAPQHHYVIRVVDPPADRLPIPIATVITARGPFATEDDVSLFREHGIDVVLSKNSGGTAAYSKIEAARRLGLPVLMIDRKDVPGRMAAATVGEVWQRLEEHHAGSKLRGV
ncbi:MAG: cobalt-precorrin-6A reductase [Hyphomicrobium sp.]